MPKPILDDDTAGLRVIIITLDNHLASATERARASLEREIKGLHLSFHAASDWDTNSNALNACLHDIAKANIIIMTMLFMEEHVQMILPALRDRRDACDAIVGCMSAPEIVKLTRIGRLNMDGSKRGALDFLKRLRGSKKPEETGGASQMAMLRRLPRILRFIPGSAQDLRAYFLTLQYWLGGSDENVANLVRLLVSRYAGGAYFNLRKSIKVPLPIEYPEIGVYHPRMKERVSESASKLPSLMERRRGVVGLLLMRSYILAQNCAHYDAVIAALEARGLDVIPIFASGLDARQAVEKYLLKNGAPIIDAFVSLTGFSLVGGPAYNDAKGAIDILSRLDVPYIVAHALEFQTIEQWEDSERGLSPVEATLMVAIPELDGASSPIMFGGRTSRSTSNNTRDMTPHIERVNRLADRIQRLVHLRRTPIEERHIAIVIFNFPPNSGATGTAAFLSVFESLFNTLKAMKTKGYKVDLPESVDELRDQLLIGNSAHMGASANVHARISADDHIKYEPYLSEIEAQWGPAPGRHQSNGGSIQILGERFGNVFVGIQPAFGYEGDPMRLLFERGFAPTHAFAAFYRYLREDFAAHAILHFGTHGALEFMPGKQTGASAACWPDRLIGAVPNFYFYAANNPSEGAIAKRRSAATLISYLTPSLAHAGLYRGLLDIKDSVRRFLSLDPSVHDERTQLTALIQSQAAALELAPAEPLWTNDIDEKVAAINSKIIEIEYSLIPHGLHVAGEALSVAERADTLIAMAAQMFAIDPPRSSIEALVSGASVEMALSIAGLDTDALAQTAYTELAKTNQLLAQDHEIPALMRALDGRFIPPVAGGDLLRTPTIVPTGRNIHGFDPYRLPSAYALAQGKQQATRLIERYQKDTDALPESVAVILWGTDNLKSEGGAIAQVLALIGALPRFDSYGRLCGAQLVPLKDLQRPRIDVVVTLSGIFRDLLPLQTSLLAEACYLAATADEPQEMNFLRKHALAEQALTGIDIETAALRVFSNAEGVYGSNVGMLIDSSAWSDADEISEAYTRRKCFAYGCKGQPVARPQHLNHLMTTVDFAYQYLESVELGVTTIDQYFDSLGGIGRSVARARAGRMAPVYISDLTRGEGKVRSLSEQVALETRARILNPKWYEGMLRHGYEGVRQIEAHVTNTMGWSATTGQVEPWVYEQITRTYVVDAQMRKRMADLNPTASAKLTNRILEAHQRGFWRPDPELLAALQSAGEELEDRLEGVDTEIAA